MNSNFRRYTLLWFEYAKSFLTVIYGFSTLFRFPVIFGSVQQYFVEMAILVTNHPCQITISLLVHRFSRWFQRRRLRLVTIKPTVSIFNGLMVNFCLGLSFFVKIHFMLTCFYVWCYAFYFHETQFVLKISAQHSKMVGLNIWSKILELIHF